MAANTERQVADRPVDEVHERPADRNRYKRNTVRGLFTLVGVAVAGFLTWLASESFTPVTSTSDFWIAMGLIALGGLALGLSQLFGGWTKWGVPRISSGVFLFGWIPTAVTVGWILMTIQPAGGWQQGRFESWSDSIGILGFVNNFADYVGLPALVLGLVTAFVFDTSGPRQRAVTSIEHERAVPDDEVHDYRHEDRPIDDRDTAATSAETRSTDERVGSTTGVTTTRGDDSTVVERPTRRDTP